MVVAVENLTETFHQRIERERRMSAPTAQVWQDADGWSYIKDFREYARGRQKQTVNADQIRILSGVIGHKASDNVLKKILWEHANRLRISRFDVEDDDVRAFLFDTWVKNQLPDVSADATFATLRDGNHAIALDWIPSSDRLNPYGGRILLTRERWWDGSEGVFIMYDDRNQPMYAVKEWTPLDFQPRKRRNVYYPDMIFRFEFRDGEWHPFTVPGEEVLEPLIDGTNLRRKGIVPWLKRDGSPLGIPFVHLPNGSEDDSPYGTSLLDGGALAFQDQINAIQIDITAASMMNGSPQTTSRGFELPFVDGSTTERVPIQTGPGVHHHNSEITAEWGTLEPGDLSQLKTAYFVKLEALCRNTNTPLHQVTGEWPSGDALFRAELPLVGSVRKLAESLGPQWSTVCHRATELQNAFGRMRLNEDALITTVYEPPELRDPVTLWTIAQTAAPFVSNREVLRLAGYQPERIDEIMDEKSDEAAEALSAAQAAFSRPADLAALQAAGGQSLQLDTGTDTNE